MRWIARRDRGASAIHPKGIIRIRPIADIAAVDTFCERRLPIKGGM